MLKITSKDNKGIKSVKKLFNEKKYRDLTNLFVAESHRVISTLIANNIKMRNLFVSANSKHFKFAQDCENKGINVSILPLSIFNDLSNLNTSDGLIAVFNKPKNNFDLLQTGKYIILDRLQNPGNLGSIIRTAVAFNIDGIIISNDSVDLYHPTIIRATMGTCFSLPIKFTTSLTDTINQLHKQKFKIYATALLSTAKQLNEITFNKQSIAVIFGNEGNGLKDNILKICDDVIHIPISKKIDSLNVAVSAGIIIYKLCKQS
ncbi:MAG: RNA methyltransferase [Mycoplasmataceae bacterium]|jgi:TrmH family RNA methyltransferase|nr:RNA methyltransferase [Mycoplasmataceae bacterium]